MALDVMKIFLLFYMCDFAVGLTHCYKTTVFLHLYVYISLSSKTAKIKMFINYKREIYALAHLNLSTAS